MEVQGHRGMRGFRPENTLPGFEAAIEAGVNVLELDLQATLDGELVIHHDYFINPDRMLFLDGGAVSEALLIRTLTLAEIKQYDLGSKTDCAFPSQLAVPGTQMPTLRELFTLIQMHSQSKKIRLNLEMKRDPRHPEWSFSPSELAEKVVSQVQQSGMVEAVYYSSFDPVLLTEIRKRDAKAKLGLIFDIEVIKALFQINEEESIQLILESALGCNASILSPDHSYLKNREQVRSLQSLGFRLIPWTVNHCDRWAELLEMGVDGVITDYPQQLIEFLR